MIENIDLYLGMAIAGIFTGLGSAIGSWIANRGVLKHFEKLEVRMRRNENTNLSQFHSKPSKFSAETIVNQLNKSH